MQWPLHLTLVSWFAAPDEARLAATLRETARTIEPFEVQIGAIAQFGANKDVPVNLVKEHPSLRQLHASLVESLGRLGVVFESTQFMNAAWRPHITRHEPDGHFVHEHEVRAVDDFHLVRLIEENNCQVAERYVLGYNNSNG
jgi:2'-5' RNA ligase